MSQVIEMMRGKNGATIEEIMEAMGWQRHTVRGFVAGAMKKAGYQVESLQARGRLAHLSPQQVASSRSFPPSPPPVSAGGGLPACGHNSRLAGPNVLHWPTRQPAALRTNVGQMCATAGQAPQQTHCARHPFAQ